MKIRSHTQLTCPRSLPSSPQGDRGQPEQHAVSGRVRSLLRAVVPGVGDGPPDCADADPWEAPDVPLSVQRLRLQIPAGHASTAQQEGRLDVRADAAPLRLCSVLHLRFLESFSPVETWAAFQGPIKPTHHSWWLKYICVQFPCWLLSSWTCAH